MINDIKNELEKNDHSLIILVGNQIEKSTLIKKLEQLDSLQTINLNYHLSKILSGIPKNELTNPIELIKKLLRKQAKVTVYDPKATENTKIVFKLYKIYK